MRVLRLIIGTLLVVAALPMLVTGGALWGAMQHRGSDGAFTARISDLRADGYAIVVPDIDALLRREASFARAGQTTLRIAGTGREKLFLGIAPHDEVERYLAGHPRSDLARVRLARGPLPVDLTPVPGAAQTGSGTSDPGTAGSAVPAAEPGGVAPVPVPLSPPATRPFWTSASRDSASGAVLTWSPSSMRGRSMSLVVMNASGAPQVSANLAATVNPRWLNPTTWGLLILGTVLFVLGSAALVWPRRRRDIVYVVEPSQLPEIAARLGVSSPAPAGGQSTTSEPSNASHKRVPGPVPAPWFAGFGIGGPPASDVAAVPRVFREPAPATAAVTEEVSGEQRLTWPLARPDGRTAKPVAPPPVELELAALVGGAAAAGPGPAGSGAVELGAAGSGGAGSGVVGAGQAEAALDAVTLDAVTLDAVTLDTGARDRTPSEPEGRVALADDPLFAPLDPDAEVGLAPLADQLQSGKHAAPHDGVAMSLPEWLTGAGLNNRGDEDTTHGGRLVAAS